MNLPLEISFRNIDRTAEIEDRIRRKAAKLERFHDRITGCRVVVEAPHKHHSKGNTFHVRVELSVPGGELVVNRDNPKPEHAELRVALRDAFAAAERQLKSYTGRHNPGQSGAHLRITDAIVG
ncbi:MAG: HPF/RaiA family ribosome-associated protein [Nannocystaceae bacterium]|nr:ribosome-associated translation inhibitor RaiA [Myxococcales bacterium]